MAERGDTGGLATALALLGVRGEAADAGGEPDLFEADAPLPLATKGKSGPKGGRPPGARNRTTEEWCRYLLGRYRSPLTGLAELYSRPLGELVDELQAMADKHATVETRESAAGDTVTVRHAARINPLDVLRLQLQAQQALAPYLHKQQPRALEIDQRPRGLVVLGALEAAEDAADELALPFAKSEQNQGVEIGAEAKSHGSGSHESGLASDASGLRYRGD